MSTYALVLRHLDKDFLRKLIAIALPITLQNIMFSSRSLVDVMMLGQLGEYEIAAVGIAARATFVSTIMLVGVTTGGALLTAQYWGSGNREGVRQSTALTWLVSMAFAAVTVAIFILFPHQIMAVTTDSQQVIELGAQYLIITSVTMFVVACGASMAVGLRAVHKPGLSTLFSGVGIVANIFFSWVLIFGNLGFPKLGIVGAAVATVISGFIEIACLYGYLYGKKHLLAFGREDIIAVINKEKVTKFLSLSLPTTFNFLAWSGGLFAYQAIMGQTGVQGLAALAVMTPIESMSLALMIGLSTSGAVLVGNQLGAKKFDDVYYQAIGITVINVSVSLLVALAVYLLRVPILDAFSALTPDTRALSDKFMIIMCIGIFVRSVPMMAINGILRAGGDVKFCLYQDLVAQWLIGIPCAALAAALLGWPPEWVYLLFLLEEVVKWIGSIPRIKSRKWIKNLL
ncbi:MATE family efflux transporter [Vibrio astriarenae]|uniref:MATE family efflux transporter n=1 Tax=Vibrio astriarenae TaxID=1481923 RepID=UPI003B830136